jgi:hypothetical protein
MRRLYIHAALAKCLLDMAYLDILLLPEQQEAGGYSTSYELDWCALT